MENVKIEIPGKGKLACVEFGIKSEWNELDFDDLRMAAKYLFCTKDDADLVRGQLFTQLADLSRKKLRPLGELMLSDDDGADAMVKMYDVTNFVLTHRPVFYESRSEQYSGFTGPAARMENVMWQQFARAEVCFFNYTTDFHLEDLDQMLSYLYFKEEYKAERAPKMYKVVQGWPLEDKRAMLVNYMGLRNFVLNVPEDIVKEKEKRPKSAMEALKQEFTEESGPESALRLPMKIAGDKVGTVDQINRMMVPEVLEVIEMMKDR